MKEQNNEGNKGISVYITKCPWVTNWKNGCLTYILLQKSCLVFTSGTTFSFWKQECKKAQSDKNK